MDSKIIIYVGNESPGRFELPDQPIEYWRKIKEACKLNPTVVEVPSEINYLFHFVVNGEVVAELSMDEGVQDPFIAALQSNPRFEVIENNV